MQTSKQLPEWLSVKPASTNSYSSIKNRVNELGLSTVCVEAHCPNITECWSSGTATFMVLGGLCTRGCRFCAVKKSAVGVIPDAHEPEKLAKVINEWGLDYIVITSVCRDDLEDQGAGHFAACVTEIKKLNPSTYVEVLIPDFTADANLLKKITDSHPDVIGHNIETVERISPSIRDRRASYQQSLNVLKTVKDLDSRIYTKSAMMLGVGENDDEILSALDDLRAAGVDFVAMGQYLQPSPVHAEVKEYVTPERFKTFREKATAKGFLYVASGPFVRSSYLAGEAFVKAVLNK
ncbi:MAG: lipoyl synthase [Candidatus Marsarchaeota archaeon]|jgi:lipoic acid synthetase|nr:lipoyl synthase [Candidatus Marsarchaeota archaeon]